MTIKREVNGQMMEFELTDNEMYTAFCEQEREFTKEDIRSYFEEREVDVPFTEDQLDDIAIDARDLMDGDDCINECRWECIHDAIKEALKHD